MSQLTRSIRIFLEIFLILIIPLFTVGFDILETSETYSHLMGFGELEEIVSNRYQMDEGNKITPTVHRLEADFRPLWRLIESHTTAELLGGEPFVISMFGIENFQSVKLPYKEGEEYRVGEFLLVPDETPIVVLYTEKIFYENSSASFNETVIVGNVGDLKDWIDVEKRNVRIIVNMFLAVISILLGLILLFWRRKN